MNSAAKCGRINRDQMKRKTCVLDLGHEGPHEAEDGQTWGQASTAATPSPDEEYTRRVFESYVTASAGASGRELPHSVPSGGGHSGTQPASPAGSSFDDLVRSIPEQHGGGLSRA